MKTSALISSSTFLAFVNAREKKIEKEMRKKKKKKKKSQKMKESP
jgi:hypothetical protein